MELEPQRDRFLPGLAFPLEPRPDWTRRPVARLRYTKVRDEWSLYWFDRNSKAHLYDFVEPSRSVRHLLAEIDRDPTFIFWG